MCTESIQDVVVELQVARRRQQQATMELERKITSFSAKVIIKKKNVTNQFLSFAYLIQLNVNLLQLLIDITESVIYDQLQTISTVELESAARLRVEALRASLSSQLLESVLSDIVQSESRAVSIHVATEAIDRR